MLDLNTPAMVSYAAQVGQDNLEYIIRRHAEGMVVAVQLVTDKPAKVLFVYPDGADGAQPHAYETSDDVVMAIQNHHDRLVVQYGEVAGA